MGAETFCFGTLADGRPVAGVRLAWPGGLAVEAVEYGGVVRSLRAPLGDGLMVETVLGFADLGPYEADESYQGRVVGRCANRIDHARFEIDGEPYQVEANEGRNCLHGGWVGFSRRLWRWEAPAADGFSASFTYVSPDGEAGFPGAVAARTTLALVDADTLEIAWEAATTQATPVNLTHHLYFNLSGDPARSMLDHRLTIAGAAITPVRADLIPTGERTPVAGTPFDFRSGRTIGEALEEAHPQLIVAEGIDHNWALEPGATPAVRLESPGTGLTLELTTDQPGLQVYGGQGLAAPFVRHGGLALEPQDFPDAVNQPSFPDVVLRPGQAYRRWARYRFTTGRR